MVFLLLIKVSIVKQHIMITYAEIKPANLLSKFVACYIIIDDSSGEIKDKNFHFLPTGQFQLVIIYKDNYLDHGAERAELPVDPLIGPIKKHRVFEATGKVGLFSIVLNPLGAIMLLNDDLSSFSDNYVSSTSLPLFIRELREKLLYAKNNEGRIVIANTELLNYFYKKKKRQLNLPINKITGLIYHNKGHVNIKELSALFNCSVSKFERNFKALSGLTPKMYSRIIRFQNAVNMGSVIEDLVDVAYSLGYYDQAHFIKEFKLFTGDSPLSFFKSKKNYKQDFYKKRGKLEL